MLLALESALSGDLPALFFSCLLYLHFALLYSSVLPESLFGGSSRGAYTRIRLTGVWSSSVGNGHPLWPSEQLQEGHTWGGEGGWGHAPAQPDQLSQPCGHWGGSCCNQIALMSPVCYLGTRFQTRGGR